jgi:hypothetical protein
MVVLATKVGRKVPQVEAVHRQPERVIQRTHHTEIRVERELCTMGRTLVVVVADHKAASIMEHPLMVAQADVEVEALGLLSAGRSHMCWFVEHPDRTIRVVVVVERRGILTIQLDCRVAKVL